MLSAGHKLLPVWLFYAKSVCVIRALTIICNLNAEINEIHYNLIMTLLYTNIPKVPAAYVTTKIMIG